MQHCPRGLWFFGLVSAVTLVISTGGSVPQVDAQDKGKTPKADDAKSVDILTIDQVELKAKFYPAKGKDATCVILLHALGESSDNKEWNNFAKKLQEKGFAVMTFDFRGHGESTTVRPGMPNPKNPQLAVKGFWDQQLNQQGIKGYAANKPRPTEIKYENFSANYYPVVCNDLAAVRAWLDERDDINPNSLVLIGAKDGGTIGALWLNSEFHRFRFFKGEPGQPPKLDRQNPEGGAFAGCVWLSMSNTPGTTKSAINIAGMLEQPGKINKLPMLFLYGQGDDKGKTLAVACDKYITGTDKDSKKQYPNTASLPIEKSGKDAGRELLVQDYDTVAVILDYLDKLPASKLAKAPRRSGDESFMWEFTNPKTGRVEDAPARETGSKQLRFSGYSSFMR
jgi:hypothetical protein